MKRIFNWLIMVLAILLAIWGTFGDIAYPELDSGNEGFSAFNVRDDLEVISKKPHSVEHPENRLAVRDYLVSRLKSMGGEIQLLDYDSIPDKIAGSVDVHNVYAKFPPADTSNAVYALFMAHYDSRFAQDVLGDTVYSFGAADDGYGVGVSLEMVREALRYRDQWKQGLMVLLTDVEETDLTGSRLAMERDGHLFKDVSLVFNIEARGVKGPALLFETSSGNKNLMKLYGRADYPCTYSLTSFVYSILPNFTDFTNFRAYYPGYNFSVIDNMKYYHTDKDAFENISLRSIQHYGAQLCPMLKAYLTEERYADPDYFRADSDRIFFTVPFVGLLNFGRTGWLIINVLTLLCLLLAIWLYWKNHHLDLKVTLKNVGYMLGVILLLSIAGVAISYVSAVVTGQDFSFVDLRFVEYDWLILLICLLVSVVVFALIGRKICGEKNMALASAILWSVLSIVVYACCGGDNAFILFPLAIYLVMLLLYGKFPSRIFPVLGVIMIMIFGVSFIYVLYTAMTIGALGAVIFLSLAYFSMIYSLWRLLFAIER